MPVSVPNKPIYILSNHGLRDKPCYGLYELDLQSEGSRGFHRYQIMLIPTNDCNGIQEYRRDMGKSTKFKGIDGIRIPGGFKKDGQFFIVHKVGELVDMANEIRARKSLWDKKDLIQVNNYRTV